MGRLMDKKRGEIRDLQDKVVGKLLALGYKTEGSVGFRNPENPKEDITIEHLNRFIVPELEGEFKRFLGED